MQSIEDVIARVVDLFGGDPGWNRDALATIVRSAIRELGDRPYAQLTDEDVDSIYDAVLDAASPAAGFLRATMAPADLVVAFDKSGVSATVQEVVEDAAAQGVLLRPVDVLQSARAMLRELYHRLEKEIRDA